MEYEDLDHYAEDIFKDENADLVVLCVMNGSNGRISTVGPMENQLKVPQLLRELAENIERRLKEKKA
jgi:hypothetical protein